MSQSFVDYRFSFCISHEFDRFYVNQVYLIQIDLCLILCDTKLPTPLRHNALMVYMIMDTVTEVRSHIREGVFKSV